MFISLNSLLTMRNKSLLCIVVLLFFAINGLLGQAYEKLPYFEGFEDATTYSSWTLNAGPNGASAVNKWYISNAESFVGEKALYISADGGQTVSYKDNQVFNVAYREIYLPRGTYDLSFTWRCEGDVGADGLYVCWVAKATTTNSSATALQNWVSNSKLTFNGSDFLCGSKEWTTSSTTITQQSTTAYKLVFVWVNDASKSNPPAIVIDDIQIASQSCGKPTNVTVGALSSDITVTWNGGATGYELMYRKSGEKEAHVVKGINRTSHTLKNMEEGVYDVFVRGCCPNDTSVWVVVNNVLAYDPTAHCIDFINWENPGTVFGIGTHTLGGKFVDGKFVPNVESSSNRSGAIDFGYNSISSRHTKHYIPGEKDPRTGNELPTVPEGEVVSVRLGNWHTQGEFESVTYTHQIDSGSNMILTLKYAVVIQDPGHDREQQPVFMLELLDEYNNPLDVSGCGDANFVADTKALINSPDADGTWHVIGSGQETVLWKEWTTIGINVGQYAQNGPLKFKIRLTTYDCAQKGHYGYAYFTLSCSEGKIEGLSCGENAGKEIKAPFGFNYRWYRARDGKTACTTQNLQTLEPNDTALYKCKVMFAQDSACYFTLDAELLPRFPKAQFSPKWVPRNCNENYMKFQNTSHVTTARGATGEKCETYRWYLKNGTDVELIHEGDSLEYRFPNGGGEYEVMLRAGISADECTHDTVIKVIVPRLGAVVDTISDTICEGKSVKIEGRKYTQEGIFRVFRGNSFGGCDSTVYLDLKVIPKERDTIEAYMCSGESYEINGQVYTKTGKYRTKYTSACGCDSIVTIVLSVANMNVPKSIDLCSGDNLVIEYEMSDAIFTSYEILFSDAAKAIGLKDIGVRELPADGRIMLLTSDLTDNRSEINPIRPDKYSMKVVFYYTTDKGEETTCTHEVELNVLYASSTMVQKFDNLLALMDKEHNGGYGFEYYQWYRNGIPLEGENGTYLYLDGYDLNTNDIYTVGLTREGESVEIMTCGLRLKSGVPVDNVDYIDVELLSNVIESGENAIVLLLDEYVDCVVRCWTTTGVLIGEDMVGTNGVISVTPRQQGVYVLEIELNKRRLWRKIIVK